MRASRWLESTELTFFLNRQLVRVQVHFVKALGWMIGWYRGYESNPAHSMGWADAVLGRVIHPIQSRYLQKGSWISLTCGDIGIS